MDDKLQQLPVDERIKLVEALWDSIAADQHALALTPDQESRARQAAGRVRRRQEPRAPGHRRNRRHPPSPVTLEVRLRREAEEDLEEAATWYESQQTGLGQQFLDEVLEALETIAEMPLGYSVIYRNTRRAWMRRFPFGIFFQVGSAASPNRSRHPRRWQGRA